MFCHIFSMTRQIYELLSRQNKNKTDFSIKFTFMTKSNPAKLVQTCVFLGILDKFRLYVK